MAAWDAQWVFVSQSAPLSLVAAAGVGIPSAVLDFLGQGVGTAPQNIIGNVTLFGSPSAGGIGLIKPTLDIITGVAATAGTGTPTLSVQIQYAPDTGAGGNYQPGTWTNVASQDGITVAQLAANTVICRLDFPPPFPANQRPRFVRLNFQPLAATSFGAGTIFFAAAGLGRDDLANRYAARNYTV